jgi:hypothetical protein
MKYFTALRTHVSEEHIMAREGTQALSWQYAMPSFGEYSYRLRRELKSEAEAAPDYFK